MTYKIEKDIPFKKRSSGFPFETMSFGDSFTVETPSERNSALQQAKRLGIRIGTLKEGDKYRIWKLKPLENNV